MSPHAESPLRGVSPRAARTLRWVGIALLVVNVLTVLALWLHRRHVEARVREQRSQIVAKGPRVTVVPVDMSAGSRVITLPAEARAYDQTTLYARVGGYVREVRAERGQRVKAGDVLAIVEAPETEQAVAAARSEAETARINADRARLLVGPGVVARQDLDNATNVERTARANLSRALADRGYTSLRAPFDGVVTARYADPGALLQPATPLVDVANPDRLRIFTYVGQDAAAFIHPGDAVAIWQEEIPGRRIPAAVTRTAGGLDPRTRTMLCEIDFDNRPWGILPGSYVRTDLHIVVPRSPVIPVEALFERDGTMNVAVIDGDRAHIVGVELGPTDGKTTRVTHGLKGGETIGINVPVGITDGAKVQPVPAVPVAHARPSGE